MTHPPAPQKRNLFISLSMAVLVLTQLPAVAELVNNQLPIDVHKGVPVLWSYRGQEDHVSQQ